jgi:3-hydroxyisobutyrate dehydrogenase-like beta-hydroxyacid dehydrogenase
MRTISVALSKRNAETQAKAGERYLAAPVFGSPAAAQAAKLYVIAAGKLADYETCQKAFEAISQGSFYLGEEPSKANVLKLCGNFLLISMIEAMGEAMALASKAGIPATQLSEIVNTALFKSPVYENYGKIIATEAFEPAGFKLKLGYKDVSLALKAAESMASPMPIASLAHDRLLSAMARGQSDLDWSALARVAAFEAGLEHWIQS